jgi:hypothetical protein
MFLKRREAVVCIWGGGLGISGMKLWVPYKAGKCIFLETLLICVWLVSQVLTTVSPLLLSTKIKPVSVRTITLFITKNYMSWPNPGHPQLLSWSLKYTWINRHYGAWSGATIRRSRDEFLVVSLDFSVTYSFRPFHGAGVDPASSENEYQEHFLGVKAAGAWGWQPFYTKDIIASFPLRVSGCGSLQI